MMRVILPFTILKIQIFSQEVYFLRIVVKDILILGHSNSQLEHDLPTSVNDRVISPFPKGLFSQNFAS